MERFTVEIGDEATRALRDRAESHGRSVEEEIGGLVQRSAAKRTDDDWVSELIAMTRPGVEIDWPARTIEQRGVPFLYDDFD
jgi:plasmid stability protein